MTEARVNDPDLSLMLAQSVRALEKDPEEAKQRFHEAAERATPPKRLPCTNCGVRHRSRTAEECQDRDMSESTLQSRIRDRAQRRGWKVAHVGKGIAAFTKTGDPIFVTAMSPGWPDLTLSKAGHHLIFMELKKEEGEVSPDQLAWLQLLNQCGAHAIVVRPSDLREGKVTAILKSGSPL